MPEKFQLKWGILASGNIARTFARDLWVDPSTRNVHDIEHVVVAAASASSIVRAQDLLKDVRAPAYAKAYNEYPHLAADTEVDIVYISSPNSLHFRHAMLCLEAGKSVLCEKPFVINAKQLEKMAVLAKAKGVFLMEGSWTRYLPCMEHVATTISSGRIGDVERIFADVSFAAPSYPEGHRMINPQLGGGALLDLGIYSLTWVLHSIKAVNQSPVTPRISSTMRKHAAGVDEQTTMVLTFPCDRGDVHAIATASIRVAGDPDRKGTAGPVIRIQGREGEIAVFDPAFRPTRTQIVLRDGTFEEHAWTYPGPGPGSGWRNGPPHMPLAEGEGQGMFWEADECAYAIRDGRLESRVQSWAESIELMRIMDEVRRQNGLQFPSEVESSELPGIWSDNGPFKDGKM